MIFLPSFCHFLNVSLSEQGKIPAFALNCCAYIIQRIALKVNEKIHIRHFSENYIDKFKKGLDFLVIMCYNI